MPDGTRSFLQRWFVTTLGVLLAAGIVTGVKADSMVSLLAASLVLGVLNAFLRPILLLVALPLLVLSLGLFNFVINALLLALVGRVVNGFHVYGFWPALKGSIVISLVSLFANVTVGKPQVRVTRNTVGPR